MTPDDIAAILVAYQTGGDPDGSGGVGVRLVPHGEIEANEWDLNISRYIKIAEAEAIDLESAIFAYREARENRRAAERSLFIRLTAAGIVDLGDDE